MGVLPVFAQTSLTQLQSQLVATKNAIVSTRQELATTNQLVTSTKSQLSVVGAQIQKTQAEISTLNAQIQTLQGELTQETGIYQEKQKQFAAVKVQAESVMRWQQTHGLVTMLSVMLQVQSFQAFVSRLSLVSQIFKAQSRTLHELASLETSIQATITQENAQKASLAADLSQVAARQAQLVVSQNKEKSLLATYDAKQQTLLAADKKLQSEQADLSKEIAQLAQDIQAGQLTYDQIYAMVSVIAVAYGIDPKLVMAVIREESGGYTTATSKVGAEGLMQLMPGTAKDWGVQDPYDPKQNLQGGIALLSYLITHYNGNIPLALAAYNAGPGAVARYGNQIPPYPETQRYVANIMALYNEGY